MSNGASKSVRLAMVAAVALVTASLTASPALAATAGRFAVSMSGDQVVPGPGDPDGGAAMFVTMDRSGSFCFFADPGSISPPLTGVDLHRGLRGQVGEVVVQLHGPSDDTSVNGCLDIGPDLAKDIRKNAENYYIDIHNEEFPDGALRGQMG